jgi:type IV secretory pathway VirB6-like protein
MKKTADLLCILIMFSVRADFFEKALRYAKCGYHLFPNDIRFVELYAYTLVLSEDYETAENVLSSVDIPTQNIAYLKGRIAVMLGLPAAEKRGRISRYLNYWTTAR